MTMFRSTRRHVLLLEVLIAFAIIALCILPLIHPHVFILRSEHEFVAEVELDHVVNLLYADRLQKLYQNKISWDDIESGREMPVDEAMLRGIGVDGPLAYTGTYKFVEKKHKISDPPAKAAYIFELVFIFAKAQQKPLIYTYDIVMERKTA